MTEPNERSDQPIDARAISREAAGQVETFEARAEEAIEWRADVRRLRLTAAEISTLRYVLVDWASDCGVGSVTVHEATVEHEAKVQAAAEEVEMRVGKASRRQAASFEELIDSALTKHVLRLSRRPPRRTRADRKRDKWRKADEEIDLIWQTMTVKGPPAMARPGQMGASERWADKSTADQRFNRDRDDHGRPVQLPGECELTLRSWRALKIVDARSPLSLVILNALYGDLPPGLPQRGLWSKTLDPEYRRVCRYAPSSGGSAYALEQSVAVEKQRRTGEGEQTWRSRVAAGTAARKARLAKVGDECEQLIVNASNAYRAALKRVS